MSTLSRRVITAALLLPPVVGWILYMPSPWFDWVFGAVIMLAAVELIALFEFPQEKWVVGISMGSLLLMLLGVGFMQAIFMLALGWFLVLLCKHGDKQQLQRLALAQWMMVWLLIFFWVGMQTHSQKHGNYFILGACLGTWASDIAAYFVGRHFGRRKLCPAISPGKTWEGIMGAFALGVPVAAAFWAEYLPLSAPFTVALAVVLVASGITGDLAESAMKRAVGSKDSGHLLPGHGGLLDRIDALVISLPATGMIWLSL